MDINIDELLAKVKFIAQGPDGDFLCKFVEILYERGGAQTEYDDEPLSPEEKAAVTEAREAIRGGDMTQFISLEEFERKHGL